MICFPSNNDTCWVCGLASCKFDNMSECPIFEEDLKRIGFKKINVSKTQSGGTRFYYYCYDFGQYSMQLISSASDELNDGHWIIKILEYNDFVFEDPNTLIQFIDIMNKIKK